MASSFQEHASASVFLYPINFVCVCVCVGGGGAYTVVTLSIHLSVHPSIRASVSVSIRNTGFFLISWKGSDGYLSVSADTLISIRWTYIRETKGQGPNLLELLPFVKNFLNAVKSLCALQWLEFYQTSTDTLSGWGKEGIRFLWPWPYFQGHYIINTQKVSLVNTEKVCVHTISLINGWNLTKLAQVHHKDVGKKWLDLGDLDLIFKVTTL